MLSTPRSGCHCGRGHRPGSPQSDNRGVSHRQLNGLISPPSRRRFYYFPLYSQQLTLPSPSFRIIRLEFNHSCADYFTEIDAVLLKGSACFNRNSNRLNILKLNSDRRGYILKRLENFEVRVGENEQQGQQMLKNFLENDLKEFIRDTQMPAERQFSLPDIPVSRRLSCP